MKVTDVFSWMPVTDVSIEELEQIFMEHQDGTYKGEYRL